MDSADPEGIIETVSRRVDLLGALRSGPRAKRALVSELSISRSTVDRAVRELESAGLVTRESGTVGLTFAGRLTLSAYEEFYESVAGLRRGKDVLGPIPADASMDPAVFEGATVVRSEPHAPHRPVQELKDYLRDANRIRGVASAVLPEYVTLYSRQIVEEGAEVELVVSEPVLETLVGKYGESLEASLATGRLDLYAIAGTPPFSTIIADRDEPELSVVVYGDSGVVGLIHNAAPDAVRWGEQWIEDWRERGTVIGGPDVLET